MGTKTIITTDVSLQNPRLHCSWFGLHDMLLYVHCRYTWDQIVITLAKGSTAQLQACNFRPSAKVGLFSRWAPLNSIKGHLITHMGDFLPPACCCAKHDPFTSHSASTCFTCQRCLQPENTYLWICAAWLEWHLLCVICVFVVQS